MRKILWKDLSIEQMEEDKKANYVVDGDKKVAIRIPKWIPDCFHRLILKYFQ